MKTVGVLGGMGPKATVYFNDMIIENTHAHMDQDHINLIISCHSTIPDRTDYLLGKSKNNPIPYLIHDAKMLERCGCSFLVLTCNTSHFAYDEISKNIDIPLLNMPEEVAKLINDNPNIKKVGIMATIGTLKARIYEKFLKKEIYYPSDEINNKVMSLIYDKVKCGLPVSKKEFYDVAGEYFNHGCDIIITACTELSVIVHDNHLYSDNRIIDSMKVLVDKTIDLTKNNEN